MMFAKVILELSVKSLDRPFQYRVPEQLAKDAVVGARVALPFGKGNREVSGYIIGLSDTPEYDIDKTKSILHIEKQGVVAESHLLSLAYWMKEQYGSTMSDAIRAVMPVRREVQEKVERFLFPAQPKEKLQELCDICKKKHHTAKKRLLDALLLAMENGSGCIDYAHVTKTLKVAPSVIRGLAQQGILTVSTKQLYRNPAQYRSQETLPKRLNEEQQRIVDTFCADRDSGQYRTYLIHGVTGSGKTEVYMALIERVLREGRQAIMLIPEIALTLQTMQRFSARFGESVSFVHSRLSQGERYDQFIRAKRGELQIMVGARSALFTPFPRLGLIVMDEEHESGYQSDAAPRYHAREVAVQRAKMLGASVVLGSATPSMEAYYRCKQGEYQLLELKKRASGASMARVLVADMRRELAEGNYSIFSRMLREKIEERLQNQEQIMLFLNRRGYAGFVSCRSCGEVIRCNQCSVAMKPHEYKKGAYVLKCHYCNAQRAMPRVCPTCGSRYIGTFGLGTQQVEDMTKKAFPAARVLRMDADTTGGKEGHSRILKAFAAHEADILIGTQMIVKGHDFANVTLVGALAADLSLNTESYRAAEHTFQLLVQAAGRAGRGRQAGEAVFQTYQPEHYSIVCAARQDYQAFYEKEIAVRRMLHYPPVSNILEILVSAEEQETAGSLAAEIAGQLKGGRDCVVLGPADAPIARLRGWYRFRLFVKSASYEALCRARDRAQAILQTEDAYTHCRITFDFNR